MGKRYGLESLPRRGSRKAPPTFPTEAEDLEDFLDEFRNLTRKHKLEDHEKCQAITFYMRAGARHQVKKMAAYREKDWPALKKKIKKKLEDYEDEDEDRYRRKLRKKKKRREDSSDDESELEALSTATCDSEDEDLIEPHYHHSIPASTIPLPQEPQEKSQGWQEGGKEGGKEGEKDELISKGEYVTYAFNHTQDESTEVPTPTDTSNEVRRVIGNTEKAQEDEQRKLKRG
jgi:hypothetical protein